jgi:tetratricopeptide (TPR) repeat protein
VNHRSGRARGRVQPRDHGPLRPWGGYPTAIDGRVRGQQATEAPAEPGPGAGKVRTAPGPVAGDVRTVDDLGAVLRELRRRHARRRGGAELTYREIAAATGWSHGIIGEYLAGRVLPPTDRFDTLVRLFGASAAEQGALATARDRAEEGRRRASVETPVPRQLPLEVSGFVGRSRQLAELDALLGGREAVIGAICGTAGVGKTALAVRFAHRVADRCPDGQLYVDLRGYGPEPSVPPGDALAGFLRALGVDGTDIPADLDERAAYYRTVLATRRVLLVLDNAADADQVRPLLPGTPSGFVVVTSRDDLAGLVAREGARRLDLDVLDDAEALALLRTLIGARVDAAPAAARTLAQRCARLPLALRIAAELAIAHPDVDLAELAGELRVERDRLDALDASGDPRTAIRNVFSWSYQHLSEPGARAFGLLGLYPGRDVDAYAVAALTGSALAEAREAVRELARAHLIEPVGAGRYAMHDLLRAYAMERAGGTDGAAIPRLLDYLLGTAALAMDTLYPHDRRSRPADRALPARAGAGFAEAKPADRALPAPAGAGFAEAKPADRALPAPDTPTLSFAEPELAAGWLDRQRHNLVAITVYAAEHGFAGHAADLSCVLWRYFEVGGHDRDALAVHTAAARAAEGQQRAGVLANLGRVHWWLGDHERARSCFERALAEYGETSDREGEARVLARLGLVYERLGDYEVALDHLRRALDLHRASGDRHGAAAQLVNIGGLHRRLGRYEVAADHQRRAAALFAELGDRRLEGYALGNLGAVELLRARYAEAAEHLQAALARCHASGDPGGQGSALATLGALYRRQRRFPQALDHLHRALAISREIGERSLEMETLNTLGETLHDMGEHAAALERHRAALELAERAGDRFEQARALDGVARALAETGEPAAAEPLWQHALAIFQALGVPEAARVGERVSRLCR